MRTFLLFALVLLLAPAATTDAPSTALSEAHVTGQVLNEAGAPVFGVNVMLLEADGSLRASTTTDGKGWYRLTVGAAHVRGQRVTLRVTSLGYGAVEKTLKLTPGTHTMNVKLAYTQGVPQEAIMVEMADQAHRGYTGKVMMSQAAPMPSPPVYRPGVPPHNTEEYAPIDENPWKAARENPLSTFSIDVDAASYSNVRRFLTDGQLPPADAVRVEEMINYFAYDYTVPKGDAPFATTVEVGEAPWNPAHRLVHVGIQGRALPASERPASNLVFLLDVSGSMSSPDKLPLLKHGFKQLVSQLRPQDRVAIVVYAGAAGLVLDATPGNRKRTILDALDRLQAGGSTAGAAGIRLAYMLAQEHFIEGGNNRVILATDGDFNVGTSSTGELVEMVEAKRDAGVFLTVLGFGSGNLKDSRMEQIANRGNGNYYYLDSEREAKKVLVDELGGTLFTIAKDVKIQVEFNPAAVQAYRLIGYENRLLAAEDFADDTKDAGELGAGHTVTALYEVVPAGVESDVTRAFPYLKYQTGGGLTEAARSGEWFTLKLRYKQPDGDTSRLLETPVRPSDRRHRATANLTWSAAVAGFGLLLRDSDHAALTPSAILALGRTSRGGDAAGHRAEFLRLVERYAELKGEPLASGDR